LWGELLQEKQENCPSYKTSDLYNLTNFQFLHTSKEENQLKEKQTDCVKEKQTVNSSQMEKWMVNNWQKDLCLASKMLMVKLKDLLTDLRLVSKKRLEKQKDFLIEKH
jgi:hypothetical protein